MRFKRAVQRYGQTPEPETPYQRAGQAWDERIGAARVQAKNWRLMAFGGLFLTAGLSSALIWQSMQSRVVPYVVEVDRLGEARAVTKADVAYHPSDALVAWQLARFVEAVRSISLDPVLMRRNWLSAYDFVTRRGARFLAGILSHAGEMAAVSNQRVNSYKRLVSGMEAPSHVNWTRDGANGLVRVPTGRPGKEDSARIELRSPDAAANPYLLFAMVLAAGMRGIERGYQLGPEVSNAAEAPRLPGDLGEATELFNRSEFARDTLGDRLCDWYVANKRGEWDAYRSTVTDFDRDRYLRWL